MQSGTHRLSLQVLNVQWQSHPQGETDNRQGKLLAGPSFSANAKGGIGGVGGSVSAAAREKTVSFERVIRVVRLVQVFAAAERRRTRLSLDFRRVRSAKGHQFLTIFRTRGVLVDYIAIMATKFSVRTRPASLLKRRALTLASNVPSRGASHRERLSGPGPTFRLVEPDKQIHMFLQLRE